MPQCNGEVIIECKCGCSIMRDTEEEAIAAWNTRKPIEKVVEQLEDVAIERHGNDSGMGGEMVVNLDDAIEIVKHGGVGTNDVCEYKITDNMVHAGCNNKQIASAFCWLNECDDYKYCPHCGKKIKVLSD